MTSDSDHPTNGFAVELVDVRKRYRSSAGGVEALRGVTLRIRPGERVAILGKSGCGKSTLLHLLGGLDRPTDGMLNVYSSDLRRLGGNSLAHYRRHQVGIVFQSFNLISSRTALQNVELPLVFAGIPRRQRLSHVEPVAMAIEEMGMQQNSLLQFIEYLRGQIAVGKFIMACIAGVVFLVSGLGIANTMIMSVMERTYEIGVMKGVGARNRQILSIFLGEGCLIGVVGSSLAVSIAILSARLLDGYAQQRLSTRMGLEIEPPIFIFSTNLILIVFAFSTLVTLIATAVPAWRAARIDPIAALRSR